MNSMELNTNQQKAAYHSPSPLLILAGAGTGKTTTIIERMCFLINDKGASPERILALTFSIKSAKHLKDQLTNKIGAIGQSVNASTFHSFAQLITIEYYQELGYSHIPQVMDESDIYLLIKDKLDCLDKLKSKEYRRDPEEMILSLRKIFDNFREELLGEEDLHDKRISLEGQLKTVDDERGKDKIYQLIDAIAIFPQFKSWKIESNMIDYGDMIYNLWTLLNTNTSILNNIQQRFDHIIVDEFQDNNYALSAIVKKMSEIHNSITVVGDDDQCIYSFRGANIHNVFDFKNAYGKHQEFLSIALMQNYRSNQPILDFANYVIKNNPDRLEKGDLISDDKKGNLPLLLVGDRPNQHLAIYNKIKELQLSGVPINEIAILCRTNTQCDRISKFLSSKSIQTTFFSEKLFNQYIIKDLLAYFEVIAERDMYAQSVIRIFISKGYTEIAQLISDSISRNNSIDKIKKKIKDILEDHSPEMYSWFCDLEKLSHIGRVPVKVHIKKIYEFSELFIENKEEEYRRIYNIACLTQLTSLVNAYIDRYDNVDVYSIVAYLEVLWRINSIMVEPFEDSSSNSSIQLMTIHQAKGKQFDTVIIPYLSTNEFPSNFTPSTYINKIPISFRNFANLINRSEKDLYYEDEQRVFYVAITRAEERLILLTTPNRRSRFIKDSPLKLVDIKKIESDEVCENISQNEDNEFINENNNKSLDKVVLSATKIKTYKRCPLQYKFQYIDELPGIARAKTFFNLGNVIHRILEEFHAQKMGSLDDMYQLLDKLWISDGYQFLQQEDQYKEDAKEMLKNYKKYLDKNGVSPIALEESFSFNLSNCTINGRYDRVDMDEDGNISIYDYKTSKKSKDQENITKLKKDMQLGVYALAAFHSGFDTEKVKLRGVIPHKLSILSLRYSNPEFSVSYEQEDLDKFEEDIQVTAENIKNMKFKPKKNFYCNSCDYKELFCPLYNK